MAITTYTQDSNLISKASLEEILIAVLVKNLLETFLIALKNIQIYNALPQCPF
jgi:hypothetical protein